MQPILPILCFKRKSTRVPTGTFCDSFTAVSCSKYVNKNHNQHDPWANLTRSRLPVDTRRKLHFDARGLSIGATSAFPRGKEAGSPSFLLLFSVLFRDSIPESRLLTFARSKLAIGFKSGEVTTFASDQRAYSVYREPPRGLYSVAGVTRKSFRCARGIRYNGYETKGADRNPPFVLNRTIPRASCGRTIHLMCVCVRVFVHTHTHTFSEIRENERGCVIRTSDGMPYALRKPLFLASFVS